MKKFASVDEFRAAARTGRAGGLAVQRVATSEVTEVPSSARTLRFCFSDGSVDRVGDAIDPAGWDLTEYRANPVVLWAHQAIEPPIGRGSNVSVIADRLMGNVTFADADAYEFADTIFRLAKGGFINAGSVGFLPLEWDFSQEKDRPFGINFRRQSLLEFSVCPVPANPNALAEARAKGIDTAPLTAWARRVLAGSAPAPGQRAALEQQWARATLY
jgi:HK97 family phage prohead protease